LRRSRSPGSEAECEAHAPSLGNSLKQIVKEPSAYLIGWRGYFFLTAGMQPEVGEGLIASLFEQFELIYVVADERDIVGVRTNYRRR
jgi:hypothetical protein